jgi:hypothetical protein
LCKKGQRRAEFARNKDWCETPWIIKHKRHASRQLWWWYEHQPDLSVKCLDWQRRTKIGSLLSARITPGSLPLIDKARFIKVELPPNLLIKQNRALVRIALSCGPMKRISGTRDYFFFTACGKCQNKPNA